MSLISKERIVEAFKKKERKRTHLLYEYYKSDIFDKNYTSPVTAEMISKDLGIPITAEMIYNIRKRIILPGIKNSLLKTQLEKQDKKETKIQQPIISSSVQTKEDPKKKSKNPEKTDLGKTILNSKYQNADDEKKANPFDDLLNKYDI